MTAGSDTADAILQSLRHRPGGAAFVTEIQAAIGSSELERPLRQLLDYERVLILNEPAPDPHLEHFDLRVAALIPEGDHVAALQAAREIWDGWVRQFLANHRCQ
jgi:hypothetical protein